MFTKTMSLGDALERSETLKAKALSPAGLTEDEIAEVPTLVKHIERLRAERSAKIAESNAIVDRIAAGSVSEDGLHLYDGAVGLSPRFGSKGSEWAQKVSAQLQSVARSAGGQKSVISGDYGVPLPLGEVHLPEQATTLLDLVPRTGMDSSGLGSNSFSYIRQTLRTNNAAVVPDGDLKPTSTYQFEEVEGKFVVIAHLSEAVPNRYFTDAVWLDAWLEREMEHGIQVALEQQIVYGTGQQNDEIGGIFTASGLEIQDFDTSILVTARKAITKLESTNIKPSAFVFSPLDAEDLDLAQDGVNGYYSGGPFAAGPGTLWGVPRVTSTALMPGTAILADWSKCELMIRSGTMTLAVDTAGDMFERNLTRLRVEGRFGFAVTIPGAFVRIHTGSGDGSASGSGSDSGSASA